MFAFAWHVLVPKLKRELRSKNAVQAAAPAVAAAAPKSSFGWLQADMRVPLPSYDELRDACHAIGLDQGEQVYLCASSSGADFDDCAISDDFSEYYGESVYICRHA